MEKHVYAIDIISETMVLLWQKVAVTIIEICDKTQWKWLRTRYSTFWLLSLSLPMLSVSLFPFFRRRHSRCMHFKCDNDVRLYHVSLGTFSIAVIVILKCYPFRLGVSTPFELPYWRQGNYTSPHIHEEARGKHILEKNAPNAYYRVIIYILNRKIVETKKTHI